MPYSVIENMYKSLTVEKQEELYDYLCFLISKKDNLRENEHEDESEENKRELLSLFGSVSDPTFVEPEDAPVLDKEDELF